MLNNYVLCGACRTFYRRQKRPRDFGVGIAVISKMTQISMDQDNKHHCCSFCFKANLLIDNNPTNVITLKMQSGCFRYQTLREDSTFKTQTFCHLHRQQLVNCFSFLFELTSSSLTVSHIGDVLNQVSELKLRECANSTSNQAKNKRRNKERKRLQNINALCQRSDTAV